MNWAPVQTGKTWKPRPQRHACLFFSDWMPAQRHILRTSYHAYTQQYARLKPARKTWPCLLSGQKRKGRLFAHTWSPLTFLGRRQLERISIHHHTNILAWRRNMMTNTSIVSKIEGFVALLSVRFTALLAVQTRAITKPQREFFWDDGCST